MRGPAYDSEDPLTRALAPPPDETPEQREVRLNKEAEAQRVSDLIDESLRAERTAWKKRKVMKVLLLGQSESGKTTTLKNMQLAFAPKAWAIERVSWRAVIQLNLVRSINVILDALAARLSTAATFTPTSPNLSHYGSPPSSPHSDDDPFSALIPVTPEKRNYLLKLKLRLAPLRQVEADLKARLGDGTEELTESRVGSQPLYASPFDDPPHVLSPRPSKEIVVRSHQSWKEKEREHKTKDRTSVRHSSIAVAGFDRDAVTEVLSGCCDDMVALWEDQVVQDIMANTDILQKLGDSAEYFLHRISDIARRDYTPSDDDVLRARIRTLGVQEYNIVFETRQERDPWREWAIYDVGGSRTQRRKWVSYFTDVQMLMFLAPISVFDERLAEDRKVNRLEDSFTLWDAITKSPMLQKCILILFLNKCDLLHRKLNKGIQVKTYLPSYQDRDNDFASVTRYLRKKFKDYLSSNSPARPFYPHMTSAIDAEATAITLRSVRDGLLQTHLKQANLVT